LGEVPTEGLQSIGKEVPMRLLLAVNGEDSAVKDF
jgi:hypothetical protein